MRHSLIATTFMGTTLVNGGSALAPVHGGPIAAEITETLRVPALSDGFEEAQPQRFHVVRRGETLWGIAQQELGNAARWPEIFSRNRNIIRNPHRIFPGQVLVVH
ncbi:MAG: LysM peptidoglycan-binding domain-containing protein [Gemmatimonadota bacterium]